MIVYVSQLGSAVGVSPLTLTLAPDGKSMTGTIALAGATQSGYLSSVDWSTFNGKLGSAVESLAGTSPLSVSQSGNTGTVTLSLAGATQNGYLSSGDWAAFNAKLGSGVTSLVGSGPLSFTNTGGAFAGSIQIASSSTNGYLGSADFAAFAGKLGSGVTSLSGEGPLVITSTGNAFHGSITVATSSANGYLSLSDWRTFNAKLSAGFIHPGLLAGTANRYSTPFGAIGTTITLSGNQLYAVQMQTPAAHSGTATTVSFNVTQTSSATLARVGAYLNGADNLPGVLLFDASTVAVTTTGEKFVTVNTPPPAVGNVWWLALETNGTLAITNTNIGGAAAWANGYTTSSGSPILKLNQMYRTGMTATQPLPDPFGTPALQNSASVPLLMWNI